jgi:quinol monooxygenase YgiN
MPLYIFARLEPKPGKEREIRDELALVIEPTRQEPGCIRINVFESTREPRLFYIHSEWSDEAAFEIHAELPHTRRFVAAVSELIAHPLHAVRTRQIG